MREQGIRLIQYLYRRHILVLSESRENLIHQTQLVVQCLTNLGFLLSVKKCVLEPQRSLEFLGFLVNSQSMEVSLPPQKVSHIVKEARRLLRRKTPCSVCEDSFPHNREDDSVNTSCEPGTIVLQGFSMTPLPDPEEGRLQIRQFSPSDRGSHEGPTMVGLVSDDFQQEGHSPPTDRYDNRIRCLHQGMGSILSGEISRRTVEMGGVEVSHQHPGAESCLPRPTDISPQSEEHTGASPNRQQNGDSLYINRKGGTHSKPLSDLAIEIWQWCMARDIRYVVLMAEHIAEKENTRADKESRTFRDPGDWKLRKSCFHCLRQIWGRPEVDLFAARHNHQLPTYYSYRPDPEALAVDAFAQS